MIFTKEKNENNLSLNKVSKECDSIICFYLIYSADIYSERFYLFLGTVLKLLRECLNTEGRNTIVFIKSSHNNSENNDCFANTTDVSCIPFIFNYFLLNFLPNKYPDCDSTICSYILQDFYIWLKSNSLTDVEMKLETI